MKRKLSLVLAILLFLPAYTGCGESEVNAEKETPANETTEATSAEAVPEEPEESATPYWDAVAKPDLGGISLVAAGMNYDPNYYNVLDWDEITGDKLNDGVYDRNRFVEQTLNCTFTAQDGDGVSARLQQSVISGGGDYDMGYTLMGDGDGLMTKGYIRPFNTVSTIDMSQPYWDQGAQRYLEILGQHYFGYPDFGFDHYDSMAVLFYNGKLIEEYQLDDPYNLLMEDEWTIDRFRDMIEKVNRDVNGDGEMTLERDVYGLAGREYYYQPMMYASGVQSSTFDKAESTFVLHMGDERFVEVLDAISKVYKTSLFKGTDSYDTARASFSDGRLLFYSRLLGDFKQLREVEDDYGLMCFPKYDDDSVMAYYVQNPTTLFLPVVIADKNGDGEDDTELVGAFIQAIAAYTFDVTLDLYLNSAVIGKGLRDQNSAEVFHVMVANRCFDLTYAFGFDNVLSGIAGAVSAGGKYASIAKKLETTYKKQAQRIITEIEEAKDLFG